MQKQFTVVPHMHAGVEIWKILNPEGYFCGAYLKRSDAEAECAIFNARLVD